METAHRSQMSSLDPQRLVQARQMVRNQHPIDSMAYSIKENEIHYRVACPVSCPASLNYYDRTPQFRDFRSSRNHPDLSGY